MATPEFIVSLRQKIGHDMLWLPGVSIVVVDERLEHRRGVGHLPSEGQQAVRDDPSQDVGVRRRHRVRGNDGHGCPSFPECPATCLVMVVSLGVAVII